MDIRYYFFSTQVDSGYLFSFGKMASSSFGYALRKSLTFYVFLRASLIWLFADIMLGEIWDFFLVFKKRKKGYCPYVRLLNGWMSLCSSVRKKILYCKLKCLPGIYRWAQKFCKGKNNMWVMKWRKDDLVHNVCISLATKWWYFIKNVKKAFIILHL